MDVTGKSKGFTLSAVAVACMFAFNAQAATDCSGIEKWQSDKAYTSGSTVQRDKNVYKANWWTMGNDPKTSSGQYQEWKKVISVIPVTSLHL